MKTCMWSKKVTKSTSSLPYFQIPILPIMHNVYILMYYQNVLSILFRLFCMDFFVINQHLIKINQMHEHNRHHMQDFKVFVELFSMYGKITWTIVNTFQLIYMNNWRKDSCWTVKQNSKILSLNWFRTLLEKTFNQLTQVILIWYNCVKNCFPLTWAIILQKKLLLFVLLYTIWNQAIWIQQSKLVQGNTCKPSLILKKFVILRNNINITY